MSSVLRTLFGGGKQESTSTSRPVDVTPTVFSDLRTPLAGSLRTLLGNQADLLAGIPTYGGRTTAPITPGEQDLISTLSRLKGGVGSNLLADTAAGVYTDPATNPFLTPLIRAVQRPILQGLEETLTRALPARFTAAGHFIQPHGSSAFDRAAALAFRSAADASADIGTKIGSAAYEAERGRQHDAIRLGQQEVNTVIGNLQAHSLPRMIEQYGLDAALQLFRERLNILMNVLGLTANVSQPRIGQEAQSTSSGETQGGILPTLLAPFRFMTNVGFTV